MKNLKLMMMAGLFAFAASANAQKLDVFSATDVTFGDDLKANLEVSINYETTETIVGWNLSLYLPEGVTIEQVWNEDDEVWEYIYTAKGEGYSNSNAMANQLQIKEKPDGGYLIVCIDQKNKKEMKNTQGKILTLPLVASSKDCAGEGKITNCGMSNNKDQSVELGNINDVTFKVGDGTVGINDINATMTDAPAYNLQGIRVNNAKGLIIRDGKKMIVK